MTKSLLILLDRKTGIKPKAVAYAFIIAVAAAEG